MNELTLPPSPNWYLSNVLACGSDGTIAWGANNAIVVAKVKEDSKKLDFSLINKAYIDKVKCIAISPEPDETGFHRLLSGGDNIVKLWSLQDLSLQMKNSTLSVCSFLNLNQDVLFEVSFT